MLGIIITLIIKNFANIGLLWSMILIILNDLAHYFRQFCINYFLIHFHHLLQIKKEKRTPTTPTTLQTMTIVFFKDWKLSCILFNQRRSHEKIKAFRLSNNTLLLFIKKVMFKNGLSFSHHYLEWLLLLFNVFTKKHFVCKCKIWRIHKNKTSLKTHILYRKQTA